MPRGPQILRPDVCQRIRGTSVETQEDATELVSGLHPLRLSGLVESIDKNYFD